MTTGLVLSAAAEAFRGFLTQGKEIAEMVQAARDANDPVSEAIAVSQGMSALIAMVSKNAELKAMIESHQGHRWGFKTDVTYKTEELVPIFCEAMINGLRAVGNEFNVLEGSLYITKEGWRNRLERLPGVTHTDCRVGAITAEDSVAREFQTKKGYQAYKLTACVPASASCRVYGELVEVVAHVVNGQDERIQVVAISEHADMVLDQLKGKVEARMWERLYQKCKALSKAGPRPVEPVKVVAAITHGEKPETYDDSPLGRIRSRLKNQPAKVDLLLEAWEAFSLANSVDELDMLRNELKTKGANINLTQGDAKEVMALFEQRKKELQT